MDPASCVALATGAYKTLKAAIETGRSLQDMGSQLATWGQAISDFNNVDERNKNPPLWKKTFKGSDSETAIELVIHRKKMEHMREEIKEAITRQYGKSAWDEVLAVEAQMRRLRKEELYRKQELVDATINWVIGIICFVVGAAILSGVIWIIGKVQGRW